MKIIKASRGTPEEFMDALQEKIEELSSVTSSRRTRFKKSIKADTGTPEDLKYAVMDKITELEGGVESSTDIQASTYVDPDGLLLDQGVNYTEEELRDFYNDIHDGDPVVSQYDTFEDWLHDTVNNGYLRKVNACNTIQSSVSVDDIVKFLGKKGYDTSSKAVVNYAQGAKHLLDMYEDAWDEYGEPSKYTLDQWYKDTKMNYGWVLDELPKAVEDSTDDSCVESSEAIMGDDAHTIDWDKLWEISDRYVTSDPLSGDWATETEHEQKAISEELGVSMDEAKHLMIEHLEFPPEMFEDTSLVASTKICSGVEVIDRLRIDPNELWRLLINTILLLRYLEIGTLRLLQNSKKLQIISEYLLKMLRE